MKYLFYPPGGLARGDRGDADGDDAEEVEGRGADDRRGPEVAEVELLAPGRLSYRIDR